MSSDALTALNLRVTSDERSCSLLALTPTAMGQRLKFFEKAFAESIQKLES